MNQNLINILAFSIFIIGLIVSIYSYVHKKKIEGELEKNKLEDDKVKNAEKLLKISGYKVKPKAKFSYFFSLNGKYAEVILKPNFIATKNFKSYVVIVNDSDKGIAENPVLRKSTAEFYYAGHFYGVLILDVENQKIDKIVYINKKDQLNKKVYRALLLIILILLTTTMFFLINFLDKKAI